MNALKWSVALIPVVLFQAIWADSANAGQLLDWLTGKNRPAAQTAYMPATGGCETCTMTCQRTVVNYVPQTQYRTQWTQVPVTQYRPVTSADPCTGCSVTCMKPCTTYQWQAQRVPYTTYRPVYNTVTVQRPVTTMMPGTAYPSAVLPSSGCSTCGVTAPMTTLPASTMPGTGVLTPGGTYLSPQPATNYGGTTYGTPAPATSYPSGAQPTNLGAGSLAPSNLAPSSGGNAADFPPTLDPNNLPSTTQRIVIPPTLDKSILSAPVESTNPEGSGVNSPVDNEGASRSAPQRIQPVQDPAPSLRLQTQPGQAPALLKDGDQTARAPVHTPWDYSPVRLAVYRKPAGERGTQARTTQFTQGGAARVSDSGSLQPAARPEVKNQGWHSLGQ